MKLRNTITASSGGCSAHLDSWNSPSEVNPPRNQSHYNEKILRLLQSRDECVYVSDLHLSYLSKTSTFEETLHQHRHIFSFVFCIIFFIKQKDWGVHQGGKRKGKDRRMLIH